MVLYSCSGLYAAIWCAVAYLVITQYVLPPGNDCTPISYSKTSATRQKLMLKRMINAPVSSSLHRLHPCNNHVFCRRVAMNRLAIVRALFALRHDGPIETGSKDRQSTSPAGKDNAIDSEDSARYCYRALYDGKDDVVGEQDSTLSLLQLEQEHAASAYVSPRDAGRCRGCVTHTAAHALLMLSCT